MKILIVDDSNVMRRIISKCFEQEDFKDIIEAKNGKEALDKMDDVDMLVTDWNMPEMNGLALIEAVRDNPSYQQVKIMMISTEGCKEDIAKAIMAGANNYIVKPFRSSDLREKIRQMFK